MTKKRLATKPRSRAELLKDLQNNKQFKEKMDFTKNKFFPALCKATTSIDDAQQNLSIINNVIMEKFLGLMKEKTMKDIDIYSNLSPEDPKYHDIKVMLELFDNMTVFDAKDILEGMRNEITLFLNEENKSRRLEDLKTQWLDELK